MSVYNSGITFITVRSQPWLMLEILSESFETRRDFVNLKLYHRNKRDTVRKVDGKGQAWDHRQISSLWLKTTGPARKNRPACVVCVCVIYTLWSSSSCKLNWRLLLDVFIATQKFSVVRSNRIRSPKNFNTISDAFMDCLIMCKNRIFNFICKRWHFHGLKFLKHL